MVAPASICCVYGFSRTPGHDFHEKCGRTHFQLSKFRPNGSSGIIFDCQMGSFSFDKNTYGKEGLETLYHLIIVGSEYRFGAIQVLYSIGWQHPDLVISWIEFLRKYIAAQVIDDVTCRVQAVYKSSEMVILARELVARIVQRAITIPSSCHHLTSIFSAVGDDAFDFIVEIVTRNSLSISNEICDDFQDLVNQDLKEKVYQDYLCNYPALIDPLASSIVDRQYLADRWKTDFVIRKLDGEYIFVEIEKPKDLPFTRYPHPSSKLSHALGQVLNWFIWVEDNISYAQAHGFLGIHVPKGVIVIGRKDNLGKAQARMLQALNDALYPRIVVLTFDDLITNARNVMENLVTKSDGP